MFYNKKICKFEVVIVPKYNLNKRKGTKLVLLLLVLSFIVAPVVALVVHLLALFS